MSTSDYFNKTYRVTNSAVKLFTTIKPFHTHVLDVVEQYVFEESFSVNVADAMQLKVTFAPKPDCDGEGWGTYYDNTFCGYDASKCCAPYTCTGGFGIVWDNTNIYAQYSSTSVNLGTNTVQVAGDVTHDTELPIVSYPSTNTVRVVATAALLDMFVGDGAVTPSQTVFELVADRHVTVRSIGTLNSIELNTKLPNDVGNILILRRADGNDRIITVSSKTTNAQGYVVIHIDTQSATIVSDDINSVVIINQTTINAGTYALWNRVTSPPGAATVVYSSSPNASIVVAGTIDLVINGEFPSPVEFGRGSIVLRTALTFPRQVDLRAATYTILSSAYDRSTTSSTVTFSSQLDPNVIAGDQITLRGFDSGSGFDGYASCAALSDTLLAPILSESLVVTYQNTAIPPAFRLAQSITRFSAPYSNTAVTRSRVIVTVTTAGGGVVTSNYRFGALPIHTGVTKTISPRSVAILAAGPTRSVQAGSVVTLTAVLNNPAAGHTLEWTQLTGAPVTLTVIDPLTVQYTSSTALGDWTFRFYVDRTSLIEQHLDATISQVNNGTATISGQSLNSASGTVTATAAASSYLLTGSGDILTTSGGDRLTWT